LRRIFGFNEREEHSEGMAILKHFSMNRVDSSGPG
jgi:hypothetical protein